MHSANHNSYPGNDARRRLQVEWLEVADALAVIPLSPRKNLRRAEPPIHRVPHPGLCGQRWRSSRSSSRAFTILEMMIVIGIIGFIAAMALPHLSGFTKGNTLTGGTRQLLDDVALARQRAIVNRSEVCMVFLGPDFWTNDWTTGFTRPGVFSNAQMTSLVGHQYTAYALISTRTVGDQPGCSNAHYLTDWKFLPQGLYIYPWQLTNRGGLPGSTNWFVTTNTTTGLTNNFAVTPFTNNILFPFPSTSATNSLGANSNYLPYIGFTPSGQLTAGSDQFIAISAGSVFIPPDAAGNPQWNPSTPNGTQPTESPLGNTLSSPNLIHIDWLTGRAKLERNQF
jgi:prepilin-type N-terminal cleavage/methylation domain-containing protein